MSYILMCSPSGTDVEGSLQKLSQLLGPDDTFIKDLENILCNLYDTKDILRKTGFTSLTPPSMLDITWNLSRSTIADLWNISANQCISEISSSGKSVKLLCCNFLYFGGRRDEYYSVYNPKVFIDNNFDTKPSHIIVLIDDVYDMYVRLTGPGEIFDLQEMTRKYLRRIENEEHINIREISPEQLSTYLLESQLGILNRLLEWRGVETLLAENLALQSKAKFMVVGVKQLADVVVHWLKESEPVSIYLSHPISRPRERRGTDGKWPDVVSQFNCLQEDLFTNNLVCIMPSAIDELRIIRDGNTRLTSLEERWPLPTDSVETILYCNPTGSGDIHYCDLLEPKCFDFEKQDIKPATNIVKIDEANLLLRMFERQIEAQTSARDHLLVSHTNGLLIFRPFIWVGEFSSGVEAEIRHWEFLAKSNANRRAAFIHFDEDVNIWLKKGRERLDIGIYNWVVRAISSCFELDWEKATQTLEWITKSNNGILDQGPLPRRLLDRVTKELDTIKYEARGNFLHENLTGIYFNPKQVGLWIVQDFEELKKKYAEIADFLIRGNVPINDWSDRIIAMLPS